MMDGTAQSSGDERKKISWVVCVPFLQYCRSSVETRCLGRVEVYVRDEKGE